MSVTLIVDVKILWSLLSQPYGNSDLVVSHAGESGRRNRASS